MNAKPQESARSKLRDRIEAEILNGTLIPGQRLDEVSVAERFGVSRTPIREALMQLASTGLVEIRPRRGAIVAQIGPTRLLQMFEVLAEFETMVGKLAARRFAEDDRAAITASVDRCRRAAEADDREGYYEENIRFHGTIYAATHNDFLVEQIMALNARLAPYRRFRQRFRNRMQVSLGEHQEIAAAVLDMDGDRASALLRAHVVMSGDELNDLMASLQRETVD